MADSIDKREIKRLPVRSYDNVRQELRSGDLVFCSGSYLFSGLIQRFTGSVWSHVGIVYRDDHLQRLFILESETGIGVRLVPISKYLRDYHGRRRRRRALARTLRQKDWQTRAAMRANSLLERGGPHARSVHRRGKRGSIVAPISQVKRTAGSDGASA
jgi:Permuted papain-like amidase enzyme, YaeF/YiiX, C92 family